MSNDRRITLSRVSDNDMKIWRDLKHLELDGLINISAEIEKRIVKLILDNKKSLSDYLINLKNDLEGFLVSSKEETGNETIKYE